MASAINATAGAERLEFSSWRLFGRVLFEQNIPTEPPSMAKRIFHRVANGNSKQDFYTVIAQVASGEIWGKRAMYGNDHPVVRAKPGPLKDGLDGIEFETDVKPTPCCETPSEVYWHLHKDSPWVESREGGDFACIAADIRKVRYASASNLQPRCEWTP